MQTDESAVVRLARELQDHEGRIFDRMKPATAIGPWYVDKLKEDVATHGGAILVAECDGAVVGYATLLARVTSAEESDEVLYTYAYVSDLAVNVAHRRKGIGRMLLEACERMARDAGQTWLRLGVLAGNHSARSFYAEFGLEDSFLTLEKRLA